MKLIVNCIHIFTVQEIIHLLGGFSPVHSPFVFLFFSGVGGLASSAKFRRPKFHSGMQNFVSGRGRYVNRVISILLF